MAIYNCNEGIVKHTVKGMLPYFCTFDIETTTTTYNGDPIAFMYIWQMCIGNDKVRDVYYGRTWKEFVDFIGQLALIYAPRMVCYVFNLGYEFQFLRSILDVSNMFAVRKRVPVRFDSPTLDWRCAWKLTNMSLAKFLQSEGVEHKKLTYDYKKLRYSDTPLDADELAYCVNDVLGFHEALCSLLIKNGHNLKTVPYTSTGYVRREARKEVKANYINRLEFEKNRLNAHTYKLCKMAGRGGNTHANYIHANEILKKVGSYDIVSSYPWTMLVSDKFPVTPWTRTDEPINNSACHLLLLRLTDVSMYRGVYVPYIARAKCEGVINGYCENGRIIKADSLILACTEIDYYIIRTQYRFNCEILEHYTARRGHLPYEYRLYVAFMFKGKCELKGVDAYLYGKYKNKFNALFGLLMTDITQSDIEYIGNQWREDIQPTSVLLDKYYKSRNSFLSYQHGLYVTAIARERLQEALYAVGADVVYCDTDSVKYVGNHDADFEAINARIHAQNMACDISPICTVNGVKYELGLFEVDAQYDEFITMGAKKYAYKIGDKYGVTVSGLNKTKGAKYLEKHGGLKAFRPDTIFDESTAGRLTAHYNDEIMYKIVDINGHKQEITSNVALVETTYTLGLTNEYKYFLQNYENFIDN